jgi:hypothetical protein
MLMMGGRIYIMSIQLSTFAKMTKAHETTPISSRSIASGRYPGRKNRIVPKAGKPGNKMSRPSRTHK